MRESAIVAAMVAAACLLIAAAVWIGLGAGGRAAAVARLCTRLLLIAGLAPGVLVGSATSQAWSALPATAPLGDSILIVALAHTARFGFVAALIGWWLARTEPAAQRDLVRLDGAEGFRGWVRALLPPAAGPLAAAAVTAGILSFHEIEAAVILQPPGVENFSRLMLNLLHYARQDDLAAGVLCTSGLALAAAVLVALVVPRSLPPRPGA